MFYVKRGTPGHWTKNVDVTYRTPFYTTQDLAFEPHERIKAAPGTMAFRRRGYVLYLDPKYVSVSDEVIRSVEVCLNQLSKMVQKEADQRTIVSLAARRTLSVPQILLGAMFVERYRYMLPEHHVRNVLSLFPKKKKQKRVDF